MSVCICSNLYFRTRKNHIYLHQKWLQNKFYMHNLIVYIGEGMQIYLTHAYELHTEKNTVVRNTYRSLKVMFSTFTVRHKEIIERGYKER